MVESGSCNLKRVWVHKNVFLKVLGAKLAKKEH